ncbi:MAG: hypothetical protein M0P16_10025 [Syntrophales bacterium]|jgi:hypothetical protein|nr:hypothetical protein [Syntrophales bacterium]MCK9391709.1 hypothetical protein [Syntrophales bacterium]
MKWIEIIKLRVAESNRDSLDQQLAEIILSVNLEQGLREIKLYRHAVVDSDLSIHLYWESERPAPQGSAAGLCLMHLLKAFGLISHSVWVEEAGQGHAETAVNQGTRNIS